MEFEKIKLEKLERKEDKKVCDFCNTEIRNYYTNKKCVICIECFKKMLRLRA